MKNFYNILGVSVLIVSVLIALLFSFAVVGVGFIDAALYILDKDTIISWSQEKVFLCPVFVVSAVTYLGFIVSKADI